MIHTDFPHRISATLLMLCLALGGAFAQGRPQDKRVTMHLQGATAAQLFKAVQQQTGLDFIYNVKDLIYAGTFDVSAESESVESILQRTFKGENFTFEYSENTIIVRPIPGRYSVRGKVTDSATGEALPGANIRLQDDPSQGTVTDIDGTFTFTFASKEKQPSIVISFMGFKDFTQKVKLRTEEIAVALTPAEQQMQDVVVTGYYIQRKESFTGAATNYSGDELLAISNQGVLQSLSALDPSFKIVDNLSMGSDPNTIPDIQVRGTNSLPDAGGASLSQEFKGSANLPTFILDGFEVSVEKIYDLDPNRVARISILKDASATAIYGSRAANGVVIIDTKAPKSGQLRLNYYGSADFEVADLSKYNLLRAADKLEYERLAGLYRGSNAIYVQEEYLKDYNERLKLVRQGVDTDWLSQPLRSVGVGQKHSLQLEGGNDSFRYGVNLTYNQSVGVMLGSGRNRLGTSIKLQYNYRNLRFMNELSYDNVLSRNSPYGDFSTYTYMNPYYDPYDANGRLKPAAFQSTNPHLGNQAVANPLYNSTLDTTDKSMYDDFTDNFSVEWNILTSLKFKGNFSIERITRRSDVFKPADHTDFIGTATNKGSYSKGNTLSQSYDGSAVISYFGQYDMHTLSLNGGWNIQQTTSDYDSYTVVGFPNQQLGHPAFGTGFKEGSTITGDAQTTRLMGLFANANYSFDDRYFVDGSVRTDGSSQFGSNQRWGTFWSCGLGWNLHNEKFLACDNINQLRLRCSTGYTGGQNFYAYQSMMMYQYQSKFTYQDYIGAVVKAFGNDNLKWQRTQKHNCGLDFAFWGNRLSGYVNYYIENSKDLLADITMASYLGFDTYKENLGETQNKGYEFSVKAGIVYTRDWRVNLYVNGGHYRNVLKRISSGLSAYNKKADAAGSTAPYVRYVEGASINTIWVVPSAGIDPATGDEIFIRKDGTYTKVWSEQDYMPYASTDPQLSGTFGLNAYYKRWELNANFYYRFGGYAYNQTLVDKVENVDPYGNVDARALNDRWQTPGVAAKYKRIDDLSMTKPTSRFIEKDNLMTANTLSVAYTFDPKKIGKIGAEHLRVILCANDFLRLSTIRREMGTSYPFARHFSLSAQLSF